MKHFQNVCVTGSMRVLLLYLLIADDDVCETTFFFFFKNKIPDNVCKKFPHYELLDYKPSILNNFLLANKMRILKHFKYRFVKSAQLYGQDNQFLSSILVGGKGFITIEEGLLNYYFSPRPHRYLRNKFISRIFFSSKILREEYFGRSNRVKMIYLTGMFPIPPEIISKVHLIKIEELWLNCSAVRKNLIMNMFGVINDEVFTAENPDAVIFTQPFSEDGIISEREKIELYGHILKKEKCVIKPHPRDLTDYSLFFPEVKVLSGHVPIELYSIMGMKFKKVYTIFSTSVFGLPYSPEIHFLGTKSHPALLKHFGLIEYKNGKITGNIMPPQ